MTSGDTLLAEFAALQIWKRSGERAPHKPLLVLHALGRAQRGEERLQSFAELEPLLKRLLVDFGPSRQSVHPEYPFWRLQSDGFWQVSSPVELRSRLSNSDPPKSELRKPGVAGGFSDRVFAVLNSRPEVLRAAAHALLEAHFPSSIHSSIATAVGINLDSVVRNSLRDGQFRRDVIAAWGHRCGFCGYDLKLDNVNVALEAAHIRWVQAGGPDVTSNGIACCSLHHVALDRGAIGIGENGKIIVSSLLHGGSTLQSHFVCLHGKPLLLPSRRSATPNASYAAWHRREVFRGEPRD